MQQHDMWCLKICDGFERASLARAENGPGGTDGHAVTLVSAVLIHRTTADAPRLGRWIRPVWTDHEHFSYRVHRLVGWHAPQLQQTPKLRLIKLFLAVHIRVEQFKHDEALEPLPLYALLSL